MNETLILLNNLNFNLFTIFHKNINIIILIQFLIELFKKIALTIVIMKIIRTFFYAPTDSP